MFKAISSAPANEVVLAFWNFKNRFNESFHVEKAILKKDNTDNIVDYLLEDGEKLNVGGLPDFWMPVPKMEDFKEIKDDLSNVPLYENILIRFDDGCIENAVFEKNEKTNDVYYILFDGETLNKNPTSFLELKLPTP